MFKIIQISLRNKNLGYQVRFTEDRTRIMCLYQDVEVWNYKKRHGTLYIRIEPWKKKAGM